MSQRTLEDQAQAMSEGYASSTEWAFHKLLDMYRDLEKRVEKLEGGKTSSYQMPWGPDGSPPDPED
jgi:hypothetical protein